MRFQGAEFIREHNRACLIGGVALAAMASGATALKFRRTSVSEEELAQLLAFAGEVAGAVREFFDDAQTYLSIMASYCIKNTSCVAGVCNGMARSIYQNAQNGTVPFSVLQSWKWLCVEPGALHFSHNITAAVEYAFARG